MRLCFVEMKNEFYLGQQDANGTIEVDELPKKSL